MILAASGFLLAPLHSLLPTPSDYEQLCSR